MLPKEERRAMLLRLYNDESPLIDHSQEQKKQNAAASQSESDKPLPLGSDGDRLPKKAARTDEVPGGNTSSEGE